MLNVTTRESIVCIHNKITLLVSMYVGGWERGHVSEHAQNACFIGQVGDPYVLSTLEYM